MKRLVKFPFMAGEGGSRRLFLAVFVVLVSCSPGLKWTKSGATDQDFAADKYSCEKDARQSSYFGTGIVGAINMQSFFQECMVAHGYSQEESNGASEFTEVHTNLLNVESVSGNYKVPTSKLISLFKLTPGQPLVSTEVSSDRDAIENFYKSAGIEARVILQETYSNNEKTNVNFEIVEQ